MQFGVLHIGIDCHHPIPISPLSYRIFLFRFAIYLVGPRLSRGGLVLGVCLTSLECVVTVYVVLVFAEGHTLVVIPKWAKRFTRFKPFERGFTVQDVVWKMVSVICFVA